MFHVDGPSHSAPSVPSILSPFPSCLQDTQSSASQPLPEKLQPWTKERQVLLLPVLRQGASALPLYPLHILSALMDLPFHTDSSLPHTPAPSH